MSRFALMTAAELSAGFAARSFSPVEAMEELLARLEALDGRLHAFYLVDSEAARTAARASEARWNQGRPLSPLDGVPTSIKDALPSIGQPGYRGSAASNWQGALSEIDAPCVARMREAGMVFLGKTTMPDYGILASGLSSRHGVTRNPWNPEFTPGGSSAGAAASIAAGINPVAVGTDIVGSIRLPASFSGIVGFKPSQGRVPYHFQSSPSLVAGPMARTVLDAALLMNVIARPDGRDFTALAYDGLDYSAIAPRPLPGVRIVAMRELGFDFPADPEVVAATEQAAAQLEAAGCRIEWRDPCFTAEDAQAAERFYKVRCRTELLTAPAEYQARAEFISGWSAPADEMSANDLYRDFNRLQVMRERAVQLLDDADFLLLPTVPRPAFKADAPGFTDRLVFEPWLNTFLFNLTEQPGISMPCSFHSSGLPIGIQIVGRRFDDAGVFGMGFAFEAMTPMREAMDRLIGSMRPE